MEPQNTQTRAGNSPEDASKPARAAERIEQAAEQVQKAAEERVNAAQQSAHAAKERAAERVRKLSSAVRKIGEHMRIEDQGYIADRAGQASERLDAVASYISEAELSTLLQDAEDFARKRPSLVFGGTFVLGFAAARLLKGGATQTSRPEPVRAIEPAVPSTPQLPASLPSERRTTTTTVSTAARPRGTRGTV